MGCRWDGMPMGWDADGMGSRWDGMLMGWDADGMGSRWDGDVRRSKGDEESESKAMRDQGESIIWIGTNRWRGSLHHVLGVGT